MAVSKTYNNHKRKLIVSMNLTLDGFLSGVNCELDWHFNRWTTDMAEALCNQLEKADALLLGRLTYMAMAKHWSSRAMDFSCPTEDRAFVHMMNTYTKYVFTNTLTTPLWENSEFFKGDIMDEVNSLKQQPGKNIMLYGSSQLADKLLKLNIIDEFHLWIHPVTIGKGKPFFKDYDRNLHLISTQTFRSGVVLLIYSTAPV